MKLRWIYTSEQAVLGSLLTKVCFLTAGFSTIRVAGLPLYLVTGLAACVVGLSAPEAFGWSRSLAVWLALGGSLIILSIGVQAGFDSVPIGRSVGVAISTFLVAPIIAVYSRRNELRYFVVGGYINAVIALLSSLRIDVPSVVDFGRGTRETAWALHPNRLGLHLVITLALTRALWPASPRLAIAGYALAGTGSILTASRTAIFSIAILLVADSGRLLRRPYYTILGFGSVALAFWSTRPSWVAALVDGLQGRDDYAASDSLRIKGIFNGFVAFLDSPIVGVGAEAQSVHFFPVQILMWFGLLGSLGGVLIAYSARKAGRATRSCSSIQPESWLGLALVLLLYAATQNVLNEFVFAIGTLVAVANLRVRVGMAETAANSPSTSRGRIEVSI